MHSLSKLNLSAPGVRSVGLFAVIALKIAHLELHLERLLEQSILLHLFLDRQLDFYSP